MTIIALVIVYVIIYRLYRRILPRVRRRLSITLGKVNDITINLGLGRLSQVSVFATVSFLTYFIAQHPDWAAWQPILKGHNSPSAILSNNVPTLLSILVFITSSAANAVRDKKQVEHTSDSSYLATLFIAPLQATLSGPRFSMSSYLSSSHFHSFSDFLMPKVPQL